MSWEFHLGWCVKSHEDMSGQIDRLDKKIMEVTVDLCGMKAAREALKTKLCRSIAAKKNLYAGSKCVIVYREGDQLATVECFERGAMTVRFITKKGKPYKTTRSIDVDYICNVSRVD